jgi:hypothetical protein
VIESIIAELDVEIARLQKVRALLVNDGPKRGRPAKTASVSPVQPPSVRREFSLRRRKSESGRANSDGGRQQRKLSRKAPKQRLRSSKSNAGKHYRQLDKDRDHTGVFWHNRQPTLEKECHFLDMSGPG